MSRFLSEILGVNSSLLEHDIRRLESASGHESVDIRLMTEIMTTTRQKTRELGLDPSDTTGRELYHAMLGLVKIHDEFLTKRIGGSSADSIEQLLLKIRSTALGSKTPKKAWVLKHSVAKKLIKQTPPKKLMKYLGYKSLDSMIKREPVSELFIGLMLLESDTWYDEFIRKYHTLTQMDFESRDVEILCLKTDKWQKATHEYVSRRKHIILSVRELGVVAALPAPIKNRSGLTITILPQFLHQINEVRLYTSFYKLHQMQSDFGSIIANSILNDTGTHVYLAGNRVHWRVVQRHFGKEGHDNHPEILEPHVQPDDFSWRKVEAALYRLEPALHFWHNTDYVAMFDKAPVSFNIMDMALNYYNNLSYEKRTYAHLQSSLWNELYVRYMGMPALEYQALKQLDYEATAPELLSLLRSAS